MKKGTRIPKILFVLMLSAAACFTILSETGLLPTDYAAADGTALYRLELLSVLSCLGGTYLALRLFAFGFVKRQLNQNNRDRAAAAQCNWNTIRTLILAVAVWTNLILYYASSYTTTPKYCLLIALTACVFCWPAETEGIQPNTKN